MDATPAVQDVEVGPVVDWERNPHRHAAGEAPAPGGRLRPTDHIKERANGRGEREQRHDDGCGAVHWSGDRSATERASPHACGTRACPDTESDPAGSGFC